MWMITSFVTKSTKNILSLFFPASCFICNQAKDNESVCATCLSQCKKAVDTPSPYIESLYSFKDSSIKRIIHAIKYFHRSDLLIPFTIAISSEIKKIENSSTYILISIPMPKLRLYRRGYNHSEALAQKISSILNIPFKKDILLRNPTQKKVRQVTTHSRGERFKNQHNSFIVSKNVQGKNIILIDDVTTTGATLNEARRVLLAHGAKDVKAFTIAH